MFQIHIDCLQISLRKNEPFEGVQTDNFTIGVMDRVANYERAYSVNSTTNGARLARLYDKNPLNPEYCQLKIENQVFYSDLSIEDIVTNFCADYNMKFHHLIQIDICVDCDRFKFCNRYAPEPFILRVINRETERQRRFNRSTVRAKFTDDKIDVKGKRHAETLYLSKTNAALKIYNKTKELAHSGKTYIKNCWPDNLAGDVWRVELSLKNEILLRAIFNGLPLAQFTQYDNDSAIHSIFWQLIEEYYIMKDNRHGAGHYCPLIERNEFINTFSFRVEKRPISASDYYADNGYNKGIEHKLYQLAAGELVTGAMLDDEQRNILLKAGLLLEQLRTGIEAKNAAFVSVSPLSNTD